MQVNRNKWRGKHPLMLFSLWFQFFHNLSEYFTIHKTSCIHQSFEPVRGSFTRHLLLYLSLNSPYLNDFLNGVRHLWKWFLTRICIRSPFLAFLLYLRLGDLLSEWLELSDDGVVLPIFAGDGVSYVWISRSFVAITFNQASTQFLAPPLVIFATFLSFDSVSPTSFNSKMFARYPLC